MRILLNLVLFFGFYKRYFVSCVLFELLFIIYCIYYICWRSLLENIFFYEFVRDM